jgi:hypothetical protein
MEPVQQLLVLLLNSIFPILVAVAGIVVAILLWKRAHRSALLLLIASVLQLLLHLASTSFYTFFMPQWAQLHGYTTTERAQLSAAVGMGFAFLYAVVYGLLIWAVAAGRRMPTSPPALPMR